MFLLLEPRERNGVLVNGKEKMRFLLLESKAKGIEDVRFMLLLIGGSGNE